MSKKSRGREKESIWMGRVGGRHFSVRVDSIESSKVFVKNLPYKNKVPGLSKK